MALVVKDRVRETTTTLGTGPITFAGAVAGFQSFSAIGDGNTTYYTINLPGANEWEVGIGTYTASGTTLSRDTILASSNGGSAVNFSAGTKDVFCTYPAGRSVYYDTSTNVSINNTLDTTNLEVTNIKAKDGTAAIVLTDSTGAVTISTALTANGGAVFNENGANVDFRVEGDNEANLLFVDASADAVGIGTSSPGAKLDVEGTTQIRHKYTGAPERFSIGQFNSSGDASINNIANAPLLFATNNTERARITSTGTLNIVGAGTAGTNQAISFNGSTPVDTLVTTSGGNVGIGTASPTVRLQTLSARSATLSSAIFGTSGTGAVNDFNKLTLHVQNTLGGSTGGAGIGAVLEAAASNRTGLALYYDSGSGFQTEGVRLDSSGNLGIGTNAPGQKLHVASDGYNFRTSNAGNSAGYNIGRNTTDGLLYFYGDQSGANGYVFSSVDGERARIDSAGNLGIGTSSPFGTAANRICLSVNGTTSASINAGSGGVQRAYLFGSASVGQIGTIGGLPLVFAPNDGERARIDSDGTFRVKGAGTAGSTDAFQVAGTAPADAARLDSSGNLLVGTTAGVFGSERVSVNAGSARVFVGKTTSDGSEIYSAWSSTTSGDNRFAGFWTETSATERGSITYNRAGGLVAYNTTSDYRAKDVTGPVANSGATIDALKVYNGKMKGATVERPMLVAHEAQEVTPYAVTGEKDAVDEDGKPKYQQMDVSSLVPLLIAEIQSLRARVAQLEQGA
jgi:hypothetical protein